MSLYEEISEMQEQRNIRDTKQVQLVQPVQPNDLTICNNSDNLVVPKTTQVQPGCNQGHKLEPTDQGLAIEQPPEYNQSGAELLSNSIEYLAEIDEDLIGWTMWKRIEQGKDHRFALDTKGAIRWERWYLRQVDKEEKS